MWTFDRFFKEVTHILSKRVLHVFNINRTLSIEVFMDIDEQLYAFKEHIKLQCDVQPESQILLMANDHVETIVGANTLIKGYPSIDSELPMFLYSTDNNNVVLPAELELPKFPTFPNTVSVENDASLAKIACSVAHECKRRIETYSKMDHLMKIGVQQFITILKTTLGKLLE